MSNLVQQFRQYSEWRSRVVAALQDFRSWIHESEMSDVLTGQGISRLLERLVDDKLKIAFIAEFSRGKSELINAIFFAEYGQRILPSSVGRTTMCPTELLYDENFPPCIRLLPIETRSESLSVNDYREQHHSWTVLPLDITSAGGMLEAFKQMSMTRRVMMSDAKLYGLFDDDDPDMMMDMDASGMVEISRWRHAIINFPHPLLKQGLVIVDTPGLNAIGTEPELTLNLIPDAHAVLFILAADTGVTKSDINIWRNYIGTGSGRMVVLNKIDSMWDELRSEDEFEEQLARQVISVSHLLSVHPRQIFTVSAQKGLVAKIHKDKQLLMKSRLMQLESALSEQLIPSKKKIIRDQINKDIQSMLAVQHTVLNARYRGVLEQMTELKSLRGKNKNVVGLMMKRVGIEKQEFDQSLLKLQATRAVFSRLSAEVFTGLGMDVLKEEITRTRAAMKNSVFSAGLLDEVRDFFIRTKKNLKLANEKTDEIVVMMDVMYKKFSAEHGLTLPAPMGFSLKKYCDELDGIQLIFQKQFGAVTLLTSPRVVLMEKFFDSIANRVKQSFLSANQDMGAWQKVVMAPLEAQIREHKLQLKNRMQSIERIHTATGSLEEKIVMFEQMQAALDAKKIALSRLETALLTALADESGSFRVAA